MIAAVLHLMNVRFEATDADEGEKDAASKVTSQSETRSSLRVNYWGAALN